MGKRVFKSVKKISKSKISDTQDQKKIQTFLRKLQQTVKESCSNDEILQAFTLNADSKRQTLPRQNSTSVHTTCNENPAYDNNYCQRCKHNLEIPSNIFPSSVKRIPGFIGKCEVELNFIQTIVWLKSITACVHQIPVEKLQQLFDYQCNKRNKNRHIKDIHIESPSTFVNKTPSIQEINNSEKCITLSFDNILDSSCNISNVISPIIEKSDSYLEDVQNESFSFVSSLKDRNESATELSKPGTSYVMTDEEREKFLSPHFIIPDTDEESLSDLTDMFEESIMFNDVEEFQSFEHNNFKQTARKNFNKQVNNEIIEDEGQYDEANNTETSNNPNTLTNYLTQLSINDTNFSQISLISYLTPLEQNINVNNFQTDQVQSKTFQINNNSSCTETSDATENKNEKGDSAYDTWKIETLNNDTKTTTNKPTANKPDTNVRHYYNLRSRKEKVIENKKVIVSPSMIQKAVCKKQQSMGKSSSKKRKSEPVKNVSEETKRNKNEVISANWLNFNLELLNAEHLIHTSVKVILSTLCDKRTAQEYVRHRCWKNSLEEQAVNAVLNIVHIFKIEKKPNICEDLIETAIIETLDEIMTCVQLNETSMWIFRTTIILQFCQLLSICVKTINYLIAMLESLQSVLLDTMNGNEIRIIETSQLHLVSYALDIALQRYRVLVPRDKKPQPMETAIPCVANLWKMRCKKNEELEDVSFDLDATEKEWRNVLQKFTVVSVEHFIMAQFANVSFELYNTLISV